MGELRKPPRIDVSELFNVQERRINLQAQALSYVSEEKMIATEPTFSEIGHKQERLVANAPRFVPVEAARRSSAAVNTDVDSRCDTTKTTYTYTGVLASLSEFPVLPNQAPSNSDFFRTTTPLSDAFHSTRHPEKPIKPFKKNTGKAETPVKQSPTSYLIQWGRSSLYLLKNSTASFRH